MPTSHIAFLSEILADGPIPEDKLAYFRRRLANNVYAIVVNEFLRQEERDGLTRAKLARRIRRRPEQITKWFSSSSNWTIETLSDLLLGMKCEPSIATHHLDISDAAQASSTDRVGASASCRHSSAAVLAPDFKLTHYRI